MMIKKYLSLLDLILDEDFGFVAYLILILDKDFGLTLEKDFDSILDKDLLLTLMRLSLLLFDLCLGHVVVDSKM